MKAHLAKGLTEMIAHMRSGIPDDHMHLNHRAITTRLSTLADAVGMLERLAASPDPAETPARHALRVRDAAAKLQMKADGIAAMISNTVAEGTRSLDEAIDTRANLREDSFAQEIRASVRSLPQKEKDAILRAAVENGDGRTVAAMTNGPSVITGFSGDLADRMKDAFRRKHAPEPYQALERLHQVFSSSSVLIGHAKRAANAATDPKFIEQVQADQAAARAAVAAFNSSLAD